MPELIEDQQTGETFNVSRALDIMRRRYFHFLIPAVCGWLLVWGATWLIPPRYMSTTMILVQGPTVSSDYVQSNAGGDLQGRVASITQQVLSRTQLLAVINKLHLYGAPVEPAREDAVVDVMRKTILLEPVRDSGGNLAGAFRVSFTADSPKQAQAVTTELANLFVNENLRVQEASEDTTKFIESQLEQARIDLAAQEAKISAFQSQHLGDLPAQQPGNFQLLSGLQAQLQTEQDALNAARQQRIYLQTQIDQNKPTRTQQRSADPAVIAIDQQLAQLRAQLVDLNSRYTDKYPDVVRVKEQIAQTEQRRKELVGKDRASDAGGGSDVGLAIDNPALAQLQGQFHANQLEITNREHAILQLQGRIAEYQGRVTVAPEIEQKLAELMRGYNQSQANYDDLLKKKNQSSMATSMEQAEQGARLTILDPPSLPVKPNFPNRLKFFALGVAFGLGLGVAVAAVFEFLDDRLYEESEIKALLPVAVISEIPQVSVPSDKRRARRKGVLRWAMTAVVLVAVAAGAAFSFLHA